MNELIRVKSTVPAGVLNPELAWEDLYRVAAPIEFQKDGGATVQLEWYVENPEAEEDLRSRLGGIPFLGPLEREHITSSDWQSYWKEHFHVKRIGTRIVLVPEWEVEQFSGEPEDCILVIRPGLGFGTGEHFTTSYCLGVLERFKGRGMTLADVGTGSGILAAAAVKLGFQDILAFDHDSLACESAKDTFRLNGVVDRVTLECCDLAERQPFKADLLCANLYDTTLVQFADLLCRSAGQVLVLTGIRAEKADEVVQAYQNRGLRLRDQSMSAEWCGLTFSVNDAHQSLLPGDEPIESSALDV